MKRLAIIAVSLMTAFTAITPAEAFPVSAAPVATIQNSDVVNVQYSEYRHHGRRNGDRGRYYRGGRGYDRHYDRGYRRNNNTGAIIGGLAAGAIIGGIVAGSRNNGSSHAQSCANRYRSYRASDNTYQPNNGPRVQCR